MRIGDGNLDRSGRPQIGVLSAFVDINAAQVALLSAQPRWTTTVGLSIHATGRHASGSLLAEAQLVRNGWNLVVVRAEVFDGDDADVDALLDDAIERPAGDAGRTRVASALLTFGRIPAEASVSSAGFDPSSSPIRSRLDSIVPPRPGTLIERMDARMVSPGNLTMEPSGYVTNSFGTVTGGVYGMLFQATAESAATDLVATDVEVQFLSQSKSGPVTVTACPVRVGAASAMFDLESRVGERVLAVGAVTLGQVE